MASALVFPGLALEVELACFSSRPVIKQSFAFEVDLEAFNAEMPFPVSAAHIHAVLRVDGRHHVIAYRAPCSRIGERCKIGHIDGRAAMIDQCQAADGLAA